MAEDIDDTTLRHKFDAALGMGSKRIVDAIMRMRKNDRNSYDMIASMSADSDRDLTNDQEYAVTLALGRNGITAVGAMKQKILDAFHKAHSSGGVNLLDQNEIGLPNPGIVIWSNEMAAGEGAEASAGLHDQTHDSDPEKPNFSTGLCADGITVVATDIVKKPGFEPKPS